MPKMTDIKGENSLRTWLKGKPSRFACVVSTRAALRVVPLLAGALHDDEKERRAAIILPSFRALAAASFCARWPSRAAEIRDAARIASCEAGEANGKASNNAQVNLFEYREILDEVTFGLSDLEENVRSLGVAGDAVDAAVNAAQAVVDIVDTDSGIAAPDAATESAIAACVAAHRAVDGAHGYTELYAALEEDVKDEPEVATHIAYFWKAVERDAGLLMTENEQTSLSAGLAASLMEKALWLQGIPAWAGRRWTEFKEELPENEEWQVWTDWYEQRLVGRPASEMLEFERVRIPNDEWKRGPAHVNAIIAKLIEGQADPLVAAVWRGFEELDAVRLVTTIDLTQHMQRIRDALPNDPYQVIGATKDMLEATMKTILHRRGHHEETASIKFPVLATRCLHELGLKGMTEPGTEGERLLQKIASSAQKMIETVNELRNCAGTGHGRVVGKEPEITEADASLVASTGLILAAWLLCHDGET